MMSVTSKIFGHRSSWATWIGLEVEGRLTGVRTLFVASEPLPEVIDTPHVYFWESYWQNNGFKQVKKCLDEKLLVTLEVSLKNIKDIPQEIKRRINLLNARRLFTSSEKKGLIDGSRPKSAMATAR